MENKAQNKSYKNLRRDSADSTQKHQDWEAVPFNRYHIYLGLSIFLCVLTYLYISNSQPLNTNHIKTRRPLPLPRSTMFPPPPLPYNPPFRLNSITDKSRYPKIGEIKPPAVLMRPKGGTGNQLFQYACHYAIARKNDWPLYVMVMNEYDMQNRTWETLRREFVLDQFHIPLYEWNLANETWNITDGYAIGDFQMLSGDYPLDKVIQQGGGDYCQSESFFAPYKEELLEYFVQNIPIEPMKAWIAKIDATQESVAVHVRRGDFIALNVSAPMSFYRDCMKRIVDRLKGRKVAFFLFSDDIEYVETHLFPSKNDTHDRIHVPNQFEVYVVTDAKNPNSLQEFFLMSRCKHQIIADSTYSWWSTYLNPNPNKIVYAAHYRDSTVKNIYPEGTNEKYAWEFRNIYYPISWIAIEPQWDDNQ